MNPLTLCDGCGRLARGYWFQLRCDPALPEYAACSMDCLDAIEANVKENNGKMNKTQMEANAISAARNSLYTALAEIGRAEPFNDASKEEMEFVIESVWNGLRASMTQQSATGEIPF